MTDIVDRAFISLKLYCCVGLIFGSERKSCKNCNIKKDEFSTWSSNRLQQEQIEFYEAWSQTGQTRGLLATHSTLSGAPGWALLWSWPSFSSTSVRGCSRGFQLGWGPGIGMAIPIRGHNFLGTKPWSHLPCALDHCPAERSTHRHRSTPLLRAASLPSGYSGTEPTLPFPKPPQTFILTSCLTVPIQCLGLYRWLTPLHTRWLPLYRSVNGDSSDHSTFRRFISMWQWVFRNTGWNLSVGGIIEPKV